MACWSTVVGTLAVLGTLFIAAGLPVLLDTFARFALQGLGMPEPIFPHSIWLSASCFGTSEIPCMLQFCR